MLPVKATCGVVYRITYFSSDRVVFLSRFRIAVHLFRLRSARKPQEKKKTTDGSRSGEFKTIK